MPYIGIRGLQYRSQVEKTLEMMSGDYSLGVEVQVDYSTTIPLKPRQKPTQILRREISQLFLLNPHAFNILEYTVANTHDLFLELKNLESLGGPNIHAIQLSLPWPPVSVLETYFYTGGKLIILKINEFWAWDKSRVIQYIGDYIPYVDQVFVDLSKHPHYPALPLLFEIKRCLRQKGVEHAEVGIGVDLGFPENLPRLAAIAREVPNLSISADADGMRDKKTGEISIAAIEQYIHGAEKILGRQK